MSLDRVSLGAIGVCILFCTNPTRRLVVLLFFRLCLCFCLCLFRLAIVVVFVLLLFRLVVFIVVLRRSRGVSVHVFVCCVFIQWCQWCCPQ